MQMKFEVNQQVVTADGVGARVTHKGIDIAGPLYLVQWKRKDGGVCEDWYRETDLEAAANV